MDFYGFLKGPKWSRIGAILMNGIGVFFKFSVIFSHFGYFLAEGGGGGGVIRPTAQSISDP